MESDNIFAKCMLLVLSQHGAGGDRKIRKSQLEVKRTEEQEEPQEKAWNATKKIFGTSDEYKAITSLDSQIRAQIEAMEIPAQFQRGTFAIPVSLVPKVQALVDAYLDERTKAVNAFVEAYYSIVGAQKANLGALFDITDYPPPDSIRSRFYVRTKWLALGVPEQLKEISEDFYAKQVEVQNAALQETMEEVRTGLRSALKGLIDHLLNRLSQKDEKGNVTRLHSSAVEKITDFLDLLPAKNITGDGELQALAEKARAVVTAVDIDELKTVGFKRGIVEKRLGEIAGVLDTMIESAPVRKMGGFAMEPEEQ